MRSTALLKCLRLVGKKLWNTKEIGRFVGQKDNQRMDICHGLKKQGIVNGGLGEATQYVNI